MPAATRPPRPPGPPRLPHLPTGRQTMSPAMQTADRYARYLYDCVRRWIVPPTLEIGCGFGTYSGLLLRHGRVIAADIDPECLDLVRERYAGADLDARFVDLDDAQSIRALREHAAGCVFSSNVLEHVADDVGALAALREAVAPRGRCLLIVPAFPALYGPLDEQAGHFRRYTRRSLTAALESAGWNVRRTFYINALAGAGWWVNNRLLKPGPLDAPRVNGQLKLYNAVGVPVSRIVDLVFRPFFGLSVVAVAENTPLHPLLPARAA